MTAGLRPLGPDDLFDVEALLAERPVENLFLASKLAQYGMDRRRVGRLLGYEHDGRLTAVCLDGGTVFPAGLDPDAIPDFVRSIGPVRQASSILGPRMAAMGVYVGLSERWPGAWGSVSNVRSNQPLMVLDRPPVADGDERVRLLTVREFDSYLSASVAMYTEEIGSSPFKYGGGYERFVRDRLRRSDAYGIVEDGKVVFKADLGPRVGGHAQLQGVWLHPSYRGQGRSAPALAGMLRQAMVRFPLISLYVNDFNAPALRLYRQLGFRTVGALATVHY